MRAPRFSRPESTGVLVRFGLLALVPVVALGIALGYELNADVHQHDLDASRSTAQLIAGVGIQPLLTRGDLADGLTTERIRQVDQAVAGANVGGTVARIKVWDLHGRVVYSDNPALIGLQFPIDDDLSAALAGHSSANITSGDDPENAGDHLSGPLIQAYVPLIFKGDTRPSGAFEMYLPYAPVQAAVDRESHQLYVLLVIGLALFYASMFPIVLLAERWRRNLAVASARSEEAERLSELKSRFLAATSHELRTPLNSVLGFAQLLKLHVHGTLTPRQEQYVENIETSGRHLLAVLNDLLDMAKIEAGKVELDFGRLDLEQTVAEAIEVVEPLASAKDLPVSVIGVHGLTVIADHRRLMQVLVNLLSNAIKFTPQGGRITVEIAGDPGRPAIVDIIDTGAGIAEDEQAGVFEEFTQAEAGRKPTVQGTGLGLPVSRRLMRLMHGDLVLVESTPAGSRFRLTLAAAVADRASMAS